MASDRPSEYRRAARVALGMTAEPTLLFKHDAEHEFVTVWYADMAGADSAEGAPLNVVALASVFSRGITLYPVHTSPDRPDYLQPKYGTLTSIYVAARVEAPFGLPQDEDDFQAILDALPEGFVRDPRLGLGLLWEYRDIAHAIANIPGVSGLVVHGQSGRDDAKVDGESYLLGQTRFKNLVQELKQTTARFRRESLKERRKSVHNTLLHTALPEQYPLRVASAGDALRPLAMRGPSTPPLTRRDRTVVVDLMQRVAAPLAKENPIRLLRLKSEIELVALGELIERFERMLGKVSKEAEWQAFFHAHPFILSLAFAVPTMVIAQGAYVGGTSAFRFGGKLTDFLAATATTGNLAVIELKTPKTPLLEAKAYRTGIHAPHGELAGAIAQTLDQVAQLQTDWMSICQRSGLHDKHGYAIRGIVIIGTAPTEMNLRKSFDLLRLSLAGVSIVTFDELLGRLKEIHAVLAPPPTAEADDPPF